MTQSWDLRTYKDGDEKGILELLKLSGKKLTNEEWLWEYGDNPFGHLIGIAEHNVQVVGTMALVPTFMKIGDNIILGSQAVDLIVHPEFRHQGIFLALGKMLIAQAGKEGIDFSYGFPNKASHSGHLQYGWFDVCDVPQLSKIVNITRIATLRNKNTVINFLNRYRITGSVLRFVLQVVLKAVAFLSKMANRIGEIEDDENFRSVRIHSIESFDDRIEDFWQEASRYYPIIVSRNRQYLNWRYFQKPNAKYTVLLAERNEKVLGYIVTRTTNRENLRYGYIVDILASMNSKGVIQDLISKAIEHLSSEKADVIFCWMLNNNSCTHTYYKILRRNGFMQSSSNPLIAQVSSSKLPREFIGNSKNWYITLGDSDHI